MLGFGNKKGKALDYLRDNHPEEMAFSDDEVALLPKPFTELFMTKGLTSEALEKNVGGPLKATVSQEKTRGGLLSRAVYLETGSGKIVSLGLSTVNPDVLPLEAKMELLDGKVPIGKLLQKYSVDHSRILPENASIRKYDSNWASAYLLGEGPHYGRTYTIFRAGQPIFIADVKEIFSNRLLANG